MIRRAVIGKACRSRDNDAEPGRKLPLARIKSRAAPRGKSHLGISQKQVIPKESNGPPSLVHDTSIPIICNRAFAETSNWKPKDQPSAALVHKEILYLTNLFEVEGRTNLSRFMKAVRAVDGQFHPTMRSTSPSGTTIKAPKVLLNVLSSYSKQESFESKSIVDNFFSCIQLANLYRMNEKLQAVAEDPDGEMRVLFEQLRMETSRGVGFATLVANYLVCCLYDIDPQDSSKNGEIKVHKTLLRIKMNTAEHSTLSKLSLVRAYLLFLGISSQLSKSGKRRNNGARLMNGTDFEHGGDQFWRVGHMCSSRSVREQGLFAKS